MVGEVGAQELDGDGPIQLAIQSGVHVAHAPAPEQFEDLVSARNDTGRFFRGHRNSLAHRFRVGRLGGATGELEPERAEMTV